MRKPAVIQSRNPDIGHLNQQYEGRKVESVLAMEVVQDK
jgi:hypothetical protein